MGKITSPLDFIFKPLRLGVANCRDSMVPTLFVKFFTTGLRGGLRRIVPSVLSVLLMPFLALLISLLTKLFIMKPILSRVRGKVASLVLVVLGLPFKVKKVTCKKLVRVLYSMNVRRAMAPVVMDVFARANMSCVGPVKSTTVTKRLKTKLTVIVVRGGGRGETGVVPTLVPTLFKVSRPIVCNLAFPELGPFFVKYLKNTMNNKFTTVINLYTGKAKTSVVPNVLLCLRKKVVRCVVMLLLSMKITFTNA